VILPLKFTQPKLLLINPKWDWDIDLEAHPSSSFFDPS
jgi:hypothetical protein